MFQLFRIFFFYMALLVQEICYNISGNIFCWRMYFTKVLQINAPCSIEYISQNHQHSINYNTTEQPHHNPAHITDLRLS